MPAPVTGTSDDPLLPTVGTRLEGSALGIDVGGTGVKAALVDLAAGRLLSARVRIDTPQPSTPAAVIETIGTVVDRLDAAGHLTSTTPAGCGVPAVVKFGRLKTAANIDPSWIDAPAEELISARLGRPVLILNDADAAGLAELTYGAGIGSEGTVLLLTIGTGIGSALFVDGRLVPNTEFGHLEFHCRGAETLLSGAARERRGLGWKAWARQFSEFLAALELYVSPDLIILGGGVSKVMAKYEKHLRSRAPIVPARLLNTAGIVGAAMAGANAAGRRGGDTSSKGRDIL